VHMCMTSPPYWQLRDYGDGVVSVWGGDRDCDHDWHSAGEVKRGGQNTDENPPDVGGNSHAQDTGIRGDGVESHGCRHCGAWRGQLGLEPTREQFISNLVTVFREIRRVLRPDGSVWLNLGDTFKNKQKQLIPHRVAIALQGAGWVVRNDVTWVKPNPMPQSVKDRLNTTTEQIFHLTPQPDYWYDLDAIREPYAEKTKIAKKNGHSVSGEKRTRDDSPGNHNEGGLYAKSREEQMNSAGKNPGDVFEITTKPFPDAHFAVYPSALCDKPIKASCPPTVCAECGAPYERESEGWSQTCECDTDDTEPGIVIDPFAGAGTTLLKAKQLGRRFVGVELNAEYADMARARVGLDVDDVSRIRDDEQQHGLDGFAE
jgi:DNA modification methylase